MTVQTLEAEITGTGVGCDEGGRLARLLPPQDLHDRSTADHCEPPASPARGLRYKDQATRLALRAAEAALRDAELIGTSGMAVAGDTTGVVVSSNLGNLDTVCRVAETIARDTTTSTSPMDLPNASSNVIASSIALWFGLAGVNLTLCNGPTSGLDAVHLATLLIAAGRVERAVVVGVETRNPVVERLVALEQDAGPGSDIPPLDGAVGLVVESPAAARQRGVRPHARVARYARRGSVAESVAAVRPGRASRVDLWLLPEGQLPGSAPAWLEGAVARDLSATVGRCSGALGVLQCAVASGLLTGGGRGGVLTSAGSDSDDASAAMMLVHAEGLG